MFPGQEKKGCERCSKIPWDSLVDDITITKISSDKPAHEGKESACRFCRLLNRVYNQSPVWRTGLFFHYMEKYPHFEGSPELRSKYVCCISADEHIYQEYLPHLIVTRIEPSGIQSALRHVLPERTDISKLKRWVADCEADHDRHCALPQRPNLIGLKVIDCEHRIVVQAPHDCRFVALSYVWGDTTKDSRDLNSGDSLPQTILDSIRLTKELGFQYLWIDRYCIDQNNLQENHTQISQMGQIYLAADLTIVAATGRSPNHGLPGLQPRKPLEHEIAGSVYLYAVPAIQGLDDVIVSPWAERAWTYQEGFFSRRRLIFTERQVIYVCNTKTRYEASMASFFESDFLDSARETPGTSGWTSYQVQQHDHLRADKHPLLRAMELLEIYSVRKLSYDLDALNAIIGALHTLIKDNVYHICGVPIYLPTPTVFDDGSICRRELDVKFVFLWYHDEPARRRCGFPSWSPVAWDGELFWPRRPSRSVVDTKNLRILTQSGRHELRDYAQSNAPRDSQLLLELDAQIVDLTLVHGAAKPTSSLLKLYGVMMAFNEAYDFILWPKWDIDPEWDHDLGTLTGVFFPLKAAHRDMEDCIVILRARGDHYERVGICWLKNVFYTETDRYSFDFFDKTLQRITARDHEALARTYGGPSGREWWRGLVRNETIVLG
ncbi:tol protein [Stagonosporopsis vannaccii]|nr:tol protein [Stagonosporopsis vannaccii]